MKRYLDIFGDFLCNNREIMVIFSLLCSVTYFLPGLFFTVFLVAVFLYGRYQEENIITVSDCIFVFPVFAFMVFVPYLLLCYVR